MGDGEGMRGMRAPPLASKKLSPPLEQKIRDLQQKNLSQFRKIGIFASFFQHFSIVS